MNIDLNNKILLNGKWSYVKDAECNFVFDDVVKMLCTQNELPEMDLPVNWELAGLHNFNGSVWFVKQFKFSIQNDDLKLLKFFGVDYFADVWINNVYLGNHEGYFSPFSFDVTKFLEPSNTLIVKVNSPIEIPGKVWPDRKKLIKGIFNHHDCRPGATSKEFGQDQNTGGIWNDVLIEHGHKISVEDIRITSTIDSSASRSILSLQIFYYSINDFELACPVEFKVISPSGNEFINKINIRFKPGKNEIFHSINIELPELWWCWDVGSARLYNLIISSTGFSQREFTFGIRHVSLDDKKQFCLNGKKIFLRGTNIIPAQFLSELNSGKIRSLVSAMKEANINIVRVHAHVNRKEFYDECDKQGILVWQDFSLQWTYDESPSFRDNAVIQIKEMAALLYNHPSISFWCCHNEPGFQINSLDPFLEKAVYSIDSSRIIRRASNYEEHAYEGWYWGKKDNYAAAPMGPLVTEFGAQALPELNSLKKFIDEKDLFPINWSKWEYHDFQAEQTFNIAKVETGGSIDSFIINSQDYQADLLRTAIDFYRQKRFNGINGIFQFMFVDCWPSITWSVIDYYGVPKKGYEALKSAYQPVYLSINVRQDRYFPGGKLLFDLYIINDLHKSYENSIIKFSLNKKEISEIEIEILPANEMIFLSYERFNFYLPENIAAGEYKLELVMICKNTAERVSQNYFRFKIVDRLKFERRIN